MIRTRFAPSPTGTPESVHLGFVIRALWNYAYARKNKGKFVLRIEDTDKKRSREDTEQAIYAVLKKFNINWDEGPDVGGKFAPYRQSDRLERYQQVAHQLVKLGYAYYDFDATAREKDDIKAAYESKEKLLELKIRPKAREVKLEDAQKRVDAGEAYVVRVKIPENRTFEYEDWILKKKIKFDGKEVSDMILLKSDGYPTYHLAVVVDDIDMEISHVFRGQEWISSTPIHLYLYEGMKSKPPEIGHFTVIIDPRTGKKFSKRDMTALFGVSTWLDKGYLPEAILNYLMLLGWAPKDNREFFTLDEFVEAFDRNGVQKANPVFDENKLNWFNQQYIQNKFLGKPAEEFVEFVGRTSKYRTRQNFNRLVAETASFMVTRMSNVFEYDEMVGFLFDEPTIDKSLLGENYKNHLHTILEVVEKIDDWDLKDLNEKLMTQVKEKGYKTGDFFMDLRIAITGKKFTPPINESIIILGKEETINRIKRVL